MGRDAADEMARLRCRYIPISPGSPPPYACEQSVSKAWASPIMIDTPATLKSELPRMTPARGPGPRWPRKRMEITERR